MSQPRLVVLSEQYRGTVFPLTEDSYTIGRSEASDLRIPDTTISGRHCLISKNADGTYSIKDVGSTNGTTLNNEALAADKTVALKNGDILVLGSVEVMYDQKPGEKVVMPPPNTKPIEMRSNPVITLSDDARVDMTTRKLENLGQRTGIKRSKAIRDNKAQTAAILSVVGLIALAAIGVIVWVITRGAN